MKLSHLLPVNSALARPLVPLFIRARISANGITFLSIVFGLLGALFFLKGTAPAAVYGAAGFLLANVLDECDGKVARQTGTSSRFGALLDTWADFIVHTAFFLGLGFGLAQRFPLGPWRVLGLVAAAGNLLSFVLDLRGLSGVQPKGPAAGSPPDRFAWITEWFRVDFSVLVLVSAILGRTGWILWAGAIGVFAVWIPSTVAIAARNRS